MIRYWWIVKDGPARSLKILIINDVKSCFSLFDSNLYSLYCERGSFRVFHPEKIYIEYTGKLDDEEIVAGGIAGTSRNNKYTNVGNEGSIECYSGRVGIAAGILGASDVKDKIYNAYNVGAVYTHTDYINDSKNKNIMMYILTA